MLLAGTLTVLVLGVHARVAVQWVAAVHELRYAILTEWPSPVPTPRPNALFGALQVTAAPESGLSPELPAAANSSGGVPGKNDLATEPHHRLRRPSGSQAARGPAAQGAALTLSTPSDLR